MQNNQEVKKIAIDFAMENKRYTYLKSESMINKIMMYDDLAKEFFYYIQTKSFCRDNPVVVHGMIAEKLVKESKLNPVEAWCYMAMIREKEKK